jgi:hypothetical protein
VGTKYFGHCRGDEFGIYGKAAGAHGTQLQTSGGVGILCSSELFNLSVKKISFKPRFSFSKHSTPKAS